MMSLTFASVLNKPKIGRVLGIPEKIEHPEDPKAAKDQVWVTKRMSVGLGPQIIEIVFSCSICI